MAQLYQRKIPSIEAMCFTDAASAAEMVRWTERLCFFYHPASGPGGITTPSGPAEFGVGDWVIKEADGSYNVVKAKVFPTLYEDYKPEEIV